MVETYLSLIGTAVTEREPVVTSAGAADAGKIPALNASGQFDASLIASTAPEFTFVQNIPATQWDIVHNTARYPSVIVTDSSGRLVTGDVLYVSANAVRLNFSSAFAGTAYLT